jgi:hypothetical protein
VERWRRSVRLGGGKVDKDGSWGVERSIRREDMQHAHVYGKYHSKALK